MEWGTMSDEQAGTKPFAVTVYATDGTPERVHDF
jgi:hypothetical protein